MRPLRVGGARSADVLGTEQFRQHVGRAEDYKDDENDHGSSLDSALVYGWCGRDRAGRLTGFPEVAAELVVELRKA